LPECGVTDGIGRQVLPSGASVGAQVREACRVKSPADFVSKIEGSPPELDETDNWFELLRAADSARTAELSGLRKEPQGLQDCLDNTV
jgi:four helix bundle protein